MKTATVLVGTALLSCSSALADTFSFYNITGNSAVDAANGEAQLRMDVTDNGATAKFRFYWVGTEAMSITQIYFDDGPDGTGVLGAIDSFTTSAGVSFSEGGAPPDLPGGAPFGFNVSLGLIATADNPPPHNGISTNTEWLEVDVELTSTFAAVLTALYGANPEDGLMVGLHVQGFEGGGSESFINVVPLPPAAWAGLVSLVGVGIGHQLRRRHMQ